MSVGQTLSTFAYHPSEQDAINFWSISGAQDCRFTKLQISDGFPQYLDSPLAWKGADTMARESEWIIELSTDELVAIDNALNSFQDRHLHLSEISTKNFPLPPELAQRLENVSDECYNGRGFPVLRGLDPTKYSPEENVAIYAGISTYIAPQRGFQDYDMEQVLCHVVNAATAFKMEEEKIVSPGFTNNAMSFHTDDGEILSLYALDIATEGGRTLLAISWQLYNDLAMKRPEILHTLADNWTLDTFRDYKKHPPVTKPYLYSCEDKVILQFSRYPFSGFSLRKRASGLPTVIEAQIEAMNAIQFMAVSNAVPVLSQRGDIVYINNMSIIHGWESFSEHGQPLQRHLLKFYLRDTRRAWAIPKALVPSCEKMYGPNRKDGRREEKWCTRYYKGQESNWSKNG